MLTTQYLYKDILSLTTFLNTNTLNGKQYLIQIYSSSENTLLFQEMVSILDSHFNKPIIIGTKTNEIVYNGQIIHNQILIIFTDISDVFCDIFFQKKHEINYLNLPKTLFNQPNIKSYIQLISNMSNTQSKILIDTIKNILPNGIISGGILVKEDNPLLFYQNEFHESAYIGIVLHGTSIKSHQLITSPIIAIGRVHTITKAHDHIIESIDQIPAKQFYKSYLGDMIQQSPDFFGDKFPLVIKKENLQLPSSINFNCKQQCLNTSLPVYIGDQVTLGYGNIDYLIKELKAIRQLLPTIPCDYLTTFSSKKCTKGIINYLTSYNMHLPLFGLLTDYEFIEHENQSHLTTESITLFTLATGQKSIVSEHQVSQKYELDLKEIEHSILLKLIENTSSELNSLNKSLEKMVLQKTNELLEQYYKDALTHLPNLNRLMEDLVKDKFHSLCLVDISSFININNFYGATIGNKVLKELATLIDNFNRSNNLITFRVHADIFAIANIDTSYKLFCNQMQLLQSKIHKHCFVSNHQQIFINTTVAMSNMRLALYENTSMTLEHAKSKKLIYLIYNENLQIEDSIINNLTWTSKIRSAIDNDRIVPFFQPLYNNDLETIDRFEVLMRLIDEENNIISPYQFLPISKKAGLYNQLTKIIIKKAFNYFEDKPYKFSINLSVDDILNPQTRAFIYHKLSTFSRPEYVIFEIVESESIENYDIMIQFIQEIKHFGATIAIDDFGTGFSNFHYLFKLNVDCIKIDGSIIQNMETDKSASLVAETIVSFANKMGITTVAEYVSDSTIFDKTKALGINFAQGYYVAKPASDILV